MQFRDVIGQQAVKERLLTSSREGRVSHALLFFGQPGSGVLPLAQAFGQFLNCESPLEDDSCGVCGSCKRAAKMVHPDIHFVYPIVTGWNSKAEEYGLYRAVAGAVAGQSLREPE